MRCIVLQCVAVCCSVWQYINLRDIRLAAIFSTHARYNISQVYIHKCKYISVNTQVWLHIYNCVHCYCISVHTVAMYHKYVTDIATVFTLTHVINVSVYQRTYCGDVSATHCNTLQHTATHCKTLQHTATHSHMWLTSLLYLHLHSWYMYQRIRGSIVAMYHNCERHHFCIHPYICHAWMSVSVSIPQRCTTNMTDIATVFALTFVVYVSMH